MAKKADEAKNAKLMDDRAKALETTLASLEKQFGKGTVMKLGEQAHMKVDVVPTGCLELDLALGVGGIPKGRIIEIYGPESSGKTTVALHIVAESQKRGGIAAFIDAEHALDPDYAKKLGVNIDELYVSQPSTGEDALEICEALVRSGAVDIVVVDSVAALVPRAEIDGEMGDSFVGLQARLMSQALRKLAGVVNKTNAIVIFINQLREKVRRGEQLKNGPTVIGNRTKIKVVKNKVAPPFRTAEFDLLYGEGISREGTILDMAVERDIIHKSGAWFSYKDERIAQGRENTRQYLKDHPEMREEVENAIRATFQAVEVPQDEDPAPEMPESEFEDIE